MLALQHSAGNHAVTAALRSIERTTTGAAGPLEEPVRTEMEQRFNHDFSDVRVHTDRAAADSATSIDAKAYTVGRDIVFNHGRFAPDSGAGKHLLAHELAHVVQQSRGGSAPTLESGNSLEQDASAAASAVAGGHAHVDVSGASGAGIARSEDDSVPLWKRRLNPLFQKAREVLPPREAKLLDDVNDVARALKEKAGLRDEQIDRLVKPLQPAIDAAAAAVDTVQPKKPDVDPNKANWFGQPPLSVRLQRRAEQRQRDEEAKQGNPVGLGAPPPNPGAAGAQDLPPWGWTKTDPDPTPFEMQVRSGKTFQHTLPAADPDIDPRQAVWLGERPSDETLKRTQFQPVGDLPPSTKVFVPGESRTDVALSGDDVMPIRDPKTGELKGYRLRLRSMGDTVWDVDRDGKTLDNRGLEAALEEPAVDPVEFFADAAVFIASGGLSTLATAGKAIARRALKESRRIVTRGLRTGRTALAGTMMRIADDIPVTGALATGADWSVPRAASGQVASAGGELTSAAPGKAAATRAAGTTPGTVATDAAKGTTSGATPALGEVASATRKPTINRFGQDEVDELVGHWQKKLEGTTDETLRKQYQQAIDALQNRGRVRSWKQSEDEVRHLYGLIGGKGETAYLEGKVVTNPAGVKGVVKPDVVPPHVLGEVKNWEMVHFGDVKTAEQMMDKLADQIKQRRLHGPKDITKQTVILDLRGQVLSETQLQQIGETFAAKTGLPIENIQLIVWAK